MGNVPRPLQAHVRSPASMSLDLNSLLDLPASQDQRPLTIITSDDLNNSAFAFHTLIQSKVKSLRSAARQQQSVPVSLILVCLNQSYSHYASVAAKSFGLNLKSLREQGTLQVIDIVKDVQDYSPAANACALDVEKLEHDLSSLISAATTPTTTTSPPAPSCPTSLILIDDVRVLLALGIPVARVHLFLERVRSLCCRCHARLVIQSHMDPADGRNSRLDHGQDGDGDDDDDEDGAEEDPGLRRLLACLIACADVWIDFQKLRTGFSDKVDGSLFLYDYTRNSSHGLPVRYHYKTMERSTRICTPGGFM